MSDRENGVPSLMSLGCAQQAGIVVQCRGRGNTPLCCGRPAHQPMWSMCADGGVLEPRPHMGWHRGARTLVSIRTGEAHLSCSARCQLQNAISAAKLTVRDWTRALSSIAKIAWRKFSTSSSSLQDHCMTLLCNGCTSCKPESLEHCSGAPCSCTDFQADLGHVVLESASAEAATGGAASPPPSAQTAALSNCVPLTGKYYAYWEVRQLGTEIGLRLGLGLGLDACGLMHMNHMATWLHLLCLGQEHRFVRAADRSARTCRT